jgi:large subunit ribosomal protein L17
MRHKVAGRKLGRTSSHRRALLRNLATALFQKERILTTLPKAKELRPVVEKLISEGRKGTLHARRKILGYLMTKDVAHKVMEEIAPRFTDRPGGYTRIIKVGWRDGDKAEMALIELLGSELKVTDKKKTAKAKSKAKEEKEPEPSEEKPVKPRKRTKKAETTAEEPSGETE